MTTHTKSAIEKDAKQIAILHILTLQNSFLSTLGLSFLIKLYIFLINKEIVLVYEEDNEVKGFVSFTENSAGMMKRFLLYCPGCILSLLFKFIRQPDHLKRSWETFRASTKSEKLEQKNASITLPSAELLSISVMPNCQASGIGSHLIKALEYHLFKARIFRYKVIAGEELVGANKFYIKNGFVLATQIRIHGEKLSNVYIKSI